MVVTKVAFRLAKGDMKWHGGAWLRHVVFRVESFARSLFIAVIKLVKGLRGEASRLVYHFVLYDSIFA
ncbi:hypothetical protein [Planctomycetes bacterium CA13]|uniref:hypothetical protein n=1 Tax=Novipirellula herctigrandis TaxID=2527986 RepID=UPI0011B65BFA